MDCNDTTNKLTTLKTTIICLRWSLQDEVTILSSPLPGRCYCLGHFHAYQTINDVSTLSIIAKNT